MEPGRDEEGLDDERPQQHRHQDGDHDDDDRLLDPPRRVGVGGWRLGRGARRPEVRPKAVAGGRSSTASTGSFGSGVTGGRLDGDAGGRGSGRGWDHRGGVAAGAQERAGQRARGSTVADGLDPVDQDPHDPVRAGVEPGGVAGQVVHQPGGLGRRPSRGRRRRGRRRSPRGSGPGRAGRTAGPAVPSACAPPSRPAPACGRAGSRRGRRSGSSSRTCGRGGRRRRSPRPWRAGRSRSPPAVSQVASSPSSVLGHRTVRRSSASTMSRSVSNGAVPRSAAMSATVRKAQPFVGRRVGVPDDVGAPAGQPAEDARLLAVRPLVEQGAHGGVGQLAHPLGLGQPHDVAPARE